jgi:hypothetical protein
MFFELFLCVDFKSKILKNKKILFLIFFKPKNILKINCYYTLKYRFKIQVMLTLNYKFTKCIFKKIMISNVS